MPGLADALLVLQHQGVDVDKEVLNDPRSFELAAGAENTPPAAAAGPDVAY